MRPLAPLLVPLVTVGVLGGAPAPRTTAPVPPDGAPAATTSAAPLEPIDPLSGRLHGAWPIDPHPVRRRFDPPTVRWGAGHRGVDLGGTVGAAVHATLPGTVTFASVLAGRGVVVVDHGRFRTTYEPVTASVSVGTRVTRGEVIGHLTLSQSHCFPSACLHWGLLRGSTYLDPLSLVGGGPVRLLPMLRNLTPAGGRA